VSVARRVRTSSQRGPTAWAHAPPPRGAHLGSNLRTVSAPAHLRCGPTTVPRAQAVQLMDLASLHGDMDAFDRMDFALSLWRSVINRDSYQLVVRRETTTGGRGRKKRVLVGRSDGWEGGWRADRLTDTTHRKSGSEGGVHTVSTITHKPPCPSVSKCPLPRACAITHSLCPSACSPCRAVCSLQVNMFGDQSDRENLIARVKATGLDRKSSALLRPEAPTSGGGIKAV